MRSILGHWYIFGVSLPIAIRLDRLSKEVDFDSIVPNPQIVNQLRWRASEDRKLYPLTLLKSGKNV
jgi:hypothetical protein